MEQVDVVVVGAGSAGSAAAARLAERGLSVVVLERRAASEAGARWVNGLPRWMFERAGVAVPTGRPELRGAGERYVMTDPSGRHRVVIDESPLLFVDMRALVARLQAEAAAAGAVIVERARVVEVEVGARRAIVADTPTGRRRWTARLIVDASGVGGAVRARVPALAERCRRPSAEDLCLAAQEVRAVSDLDAAAAWLDRHGLRSGEAWGVVGLAGPWSTRMVQVDLERAEVEILTGTVASVHPSGPRLLEDFVDATPWVGPRIFGGRGAIPLRRPYDRLAVPGVALVGDAGCQVFPAHGSGVGAGLIAARLLAEAVSGDPGDAAVAVRYARAFHREVGALLGAYDVFRRATQHLDAADVPLLLAAGLMDARTTGAGLLQVMPSLDPRGVWGLARSALRAPRLAARMGPAVARMYAANAMYQAHPGRDHGLRARLYARGLRRLVEG